MVMATYSPQHVGLEFVRQYYTVLHKDPQQLHRFYTKNSLFSHGGLQASSREPIVGQEAIHTKICQLKFRDCYSKIISVDSHRTIQDGVVVQVIGNLSNDGLPMRRFMQTFVLAQQAPKKYCIFNDIFRYQDDDTEDDADANEESPESDNEVVPTGDQLNAPVSELQLEDESPASVPVERYDGPARPFKDLEANKGLVNGDLSDSEDQPEDFGDEGLPPPTDTNLKLSYDAPEQQSVGDQLLPDEFQGSEAPASLALSELDERKVEEYEGEEGKVEDFPSPVEEEANVVEEPSKPVTFAAVARKNAQGGVSQPAPVSRPAPKPQPPPAAPPAAVPQRTPPRRREDSKSEKTEGRRKPNAPPPDNNQIFIGNLPSGISEVDVRGIFKEFGNVVEVRINPKNFGFVAFDSPEPVTEILNRPSSKPITFNTKVINIEEKKSGPSGGGRGGPKKDKEGLGRGRNDGYGRGGGKGGQSGGRGGKAGQGSGGSGYQRQKSAGDANKGGGGGTPGGAGDGGRGGRGRDRVGGGRGSKN